LIIDLNYVNVLSEEKTMRIWVLLSVLFVFLGCDEPETFNENCGDGVIDVGEDCDGYIPIGSSCIQYGFYSGELACTGHCSIDSSYCEGTCGDGTYQVNSEECEGLILNGQTCQLLGFSGGQLSCAETCSFDKSQCFGSTCGDDIVVEGEECDGDIGDQTCITLGYHGGTELSCNSNCTFDVTSCSDFGKCGDGSLDPLYEDCDTDYLNNTDCTDLGYYGGSLTCSSDCTFNTFNCEAVGTCDDGTIQSPQETCDGTLFDGEECINFGHTYGGELSCDSDCQIDLSTCNGWCGDGIVQTSESETCDGTDFYGETCNNLGYPQGGELICNGSCLISESFCHTFTALFGGINHSCGILSTGDAYCWGNNDYGQGGSGYSGSNYLAPVIVAGGLNFKTIAPSSDKYTCGISSTNAAYCWGENNKGQLGDNSETTRFVPTPVSGGYSFSTISTGQGHSCGITTDGTAFCWGNNNLGQLGDNSTENHLVPTPVSNTLSLSFSAISTGLSHTCAITITDDIYCWGSNTNGQLGDDSVVDSSIPIIVHGTHTFIAISAGNKHTCALTSDSNIYCWGLNDSGQLGIGSTSEQYTPQLVAPPNPFTSLVAGGGHTCGLTSSGLYCWGSNLHGQLGEDSTNDRYVPTLVHGYLDFDSIGAGGVHTCGVTASTGAYCWGRNLYGQIGDGTVTSRHTPTPITSF
jgi:alpha-tubulin suppressor-like RCC1 family protein